MIAPVYSLLSAAVHQSLAWVLDGGDVMSCSLFSFFVPAQVSGTTTVLALREVQGLLPPRTPRDKNTPEKDSGPPCWSEALANRMRRGGNQTVPSERMIVQCTLLFCASGDWERYWAFWDIVLDLYNQDLLVRGAHPHCPQFGLLAKWHNLVLCLFWHFIAGKKCQMWFCFFPNVASIFCTQFCTWSGLGP